MYLVKTPWLLKRLYPAYTWHLPSAEKVLYLTFDDGPHETATPFALDELKTYNAKATFFCIGKNVVKYPVIYKRILEEKHAIGNHTYHHLNGWKTDDEVYVNDINEASQHIESLLFRPPYGKIKKYQYKKMNQDAALHSPFSIIMWDVLSGDFDITITPQKCLDNVIKNADNGSVIVFHDSTKAWSRMSYALPEVLRYFSNKGFTFKAIKNNFQPAT